MLMAVTTLLKAKKRVFSGMRKRRNKDTAMHNTGCGGPIGMGKELARIPERGCIG